MEFENSLCEQNGKDYILCSSEIRDGFFLSVEALLLAEAAVESGLIFVVLFGGTGSGKSSLLNFLGGRRLSPVSVVRPCTKVPCFVAPDESVDALKDLLQRFLGQDCFTLEREDIAGNGRMVLVDCPDYDSISAENRRQASFLFTLSDLPCLVLSPVKYADEGSLYWMQRIQSEKEGSLVFVTKTDTLQIGALEEVRNSVESLFPDTEMLFFSVQQPVSGLRQRIIEKINKFSEDGCLSGVRKARRLKLQKQFTELSLLCGEEYNGRDYLVSEMEKSLHEIEQSFLERQQLLQERMLSELRYSLDRIAEDKLFYISRWFVRNIGSLLGKMGGQGRLPAPVEGQNPDEKWGREILDNLLLALHQAQVKQDAYALNHEWFRVNGIDEEKFCHDFMHDYAEFAARARQRIAETFSRNVSTRHSVVAVSQEVFLSMAFYFLLGPIALFPGWEQMFSAIMYLIYGKVPARNQPSIFMEVRKLSEEYQQEFKLFLSGYLQKIREPLRSLADEQRRNKENWEKWRAGMEKFLST
jgi:GTP-binding protein EngB required for normal cell division